MNLLFCCWNSICEAGMTRAFQELGHTVIPFQEQLNNKDLDTNYLDKLSTALKEQPQVDFVFSVNYIPIIAKVCKIHRIYYLSYTVDSPCLTLYSKSLGSPYNRAFLFDYAMYNQFYNYYPQQVFYLPLGADVPFYNSVTSSPEDHQKYDCDISFVGSFHTEFCQYDRISKQLPDYIKGYVKGLISAQTNVYGYNFLADSISDEWIREFKKYANYELLPDYIIDDRNQIADMYLGYKCNQQDRIHTLRAISEVFSLDLYTTEDSYLVPNANFRGIADSKTMMPKIFQCSKINLNMTARTIKTGLPQRIFDIMAAGGFVISNYQSEIPEYFVPGEDLVMYESISDLLEKIKYYLEHDDERIQIARNGQAKVQSLHTYTQRLSQMIKDSGI